MADEEPQDSETALDPGGIAIPPTDSPVHLGPIAPEHLTSLDNIDENETVYVPSEELGSPIPDARYVPGDGVGRKRTWNAHFDQGRPGPTTPRGLAMVGWGLFGSISCEITMILGQDDDDDRAIIATAKFLFPDPKKGEPKRESAMVSHAFKVKDHPEFLEVERWERNCNPKVIMALGVHLVRYVDHLRREQVANAAILMIEKHRSPGRLQGMFEALKQPKASWAVLKRHG